MGLREWLLGPYLGRITSLETEVHALRGDIESLREVEEKFVELDIKVGSLHQEILELHKKLEDKVDKERLRLIEKEMESIENLNKYIFESLRYLRENIEGRIKSSGLEQGENQIDEEELIIELIKRGYDSPKNLAKKAHIGVGRLYDILKRLEAENRIRTIKQGRRKKIIVIEG